LAAAELDLVAVHGEVLLDLDEDVRVCEAHAIAHGRAVEIGVLPAREAQAHEPAPRNPARAAFETAAGRRASSTRPSLSALSPWTSRSPASSTRVTTFSSPGSKRTAVPAGTLSRIPQARRRSKRSARLTSKKWKWEPTWMGRSAVLATVSSMVRRPALASMSPSPRMYSPGIIPFPLALPPPPPPPPPPSPPATGARARRGGVARRRGAARA